MKPGLFSKLCISTILSLAGYQFSFAQADGAGLPHSMKGYELYSWQVRGTWYFSLIVGTNRQKTVSEVTSSRVRIKGTESLLRKLALLPAGEEVSWSSHRLPRMRLPPRKVVYRVNSFCRQQGIILRVADAMNRYDEQGEHRHLRVWRFQI